ncbi:MAG: hypothetical protein A2017_13450 [Lentisphaerae bacterium GWF2_44_16]|nr:MAG: hypothetical protein A2017_13450 [Lentisphaerae bacterium GWF2_44_16]
MTFYMTICKKKQVKKSLWHFTLIELLMVIAVIAILLCTLLPALSKAKGTVREISCRSNMKQMGLLFELYAGDYNGWAPPLITQGDSLLWITILWPYLYPNKPAWTSSTQYTDKKYGTIYRCPARNESPDALHSSWYFSYGYNYTFALKISGINTVYSPRNWRMLAQPSKTAMVMDCTTSSGDRAALTDGGLQAGALWHSGRVNILYADLHTGGGKPSEFPFNSTDIFWNCRD